MTPGSPDGYRQEFDQLMARGGLSVPPDWRDGALAGFVELRRAAELLRDVLSPELEPSNVFDPRRVMP